MSPYHQGPPFVVSSSPILPLDVQPIRPRRPAPLSLLPPPFDYPYQFPASYGVLSNGLNPPGLAPQPARSIPSDWTDDATAVSLDIHGVYSRYRRNTPGSTDTVLSPSHSSSRPLVNMPAGWDLPMNQGQHASLPQVTEAGTTFFYRSPTPSARQRTNQACEKCRDRKTKCSGGRPTCVRCQARGLTCEYATEHRVRGPARARKRNSPSLDTPTMPASPGRALFAHPYAPVAPSVNSKCGLQPLSLKAQDTNPAARTGWSLSDHSDESSDSSCAASLELSERKTYPRLGNVQGMDFISQQPLQELNPMAHPDSRFQSTHRSALDIKDQFIAPILRSSPSMPQLKPLSFGGPQSILATYSGNSYPRLDTPLNKPFREFTQESFQCPSSSSSRASQSYSSADDEQDSFVTQAHMSPNAVLAKNWPSSTDALRERRDSWKAEDPLPAVARAADVEGETPTSSSQTFNVSEWITGTDYSSSPERASSSLESVNPES